MGGIRVRDGDMEGIAEVVLSGEVDHAVVEDLRAAIRAATGTAPGWVLDLTAVTYFDSAGLRLLLDLCQESRDGGRPFSVRPPKPGMALRALRVSGVDRRLGLPEALEDGTGSV